MSCLVNLLIKFYVIIIETFSKAVGMKREPSVNANQMVRLQEPTNSNPPVTVQTVSLQELSRKNATKVNKISNQKETQRIKNQKVC